MPSPVRNLIHLKVAALLDEHRVVVWYDPRGEQASAFESLTRLGLEKVDVRDSALKARRLADRLWASITGTAAGEGPPSCTQVLIYVPWACGATDEDRVREPFAGYACLGATFGADPADALPALARMAMPQRASEIDKLFADGRAVTLDQLEALAARAGFPLLKQALGTDDATEVAARFVADPDLTRRALAAAGVESELMRLLSASFGFEAPTEPAALRPAFLRWLLFSEFAFDVEGQVPAHTAAVKRAPAPYRPAIYAVCDRIRGAEEWREAYIQAANEVAKALLLEDLPGDKSSWGERDTFAAEDRAALRFVQAECLAGRLAEARRALDLRKRSIWGREPVRGQVWNLASRALDLLEAAQRWRDRSVTSARNVRDHVTAYTADSYGLWHVDRGQRWMERAAGDCAEREELQPLVEHAQTVYRQVVDAAQNAFVEAVARDGWPPEGPRQVQVFARHVAPALQEGGRVAYFLVDALRFEMGRDLGQMLEKLGGVQVEATATVVPTTTAFGMAALLPGAETTFGCDLKDGELQPMVGGKAMVSVNERKERFREQFGDRYVDLRLDELLDAKDAKLRERIGRASLLVVRSDDIDNAGERMNLPSARRTMSSILDDLTRVAHRLAREGVKRMVFVADHGHILLPDVPAGDVVREPPGDWVLLKRRCRIGRAAGSAPGVRVVPADRLGVHGPVKDVALATGFRVFAAGAEYFHEGMSLQECVVPAVLLDARAGSVRPPAGPSHVDVVYRKPRFDLRIFIVKLKLTSLVQSEVEVRLRAIAPGAKGQAEQVGQAADCEARDPATGLIRLRVGVEESVAVRIADEFSGPEVEVQILDAGGTGVVLGKKKLKNGCLD